MELADIRQMFRLMDKFAEEDNLSTLVCHFPISVKEKMHITIAQRAIINEKKRFDLKTFDFNEWII